MIAPHSIPETMTRIVTGLAALLLICSAMAFTTSTPEEADPHAMAVVEKVDGYYIFHKAMPTAAYEVIGELKEPKFAMNGKPDEMFKLALKALKKDYPKADAVIISSLQDGAGQAIMFK